MSEVLDNAMNELKNNNIIVEWCDKLSPPRYERIADSIATLVDFCESHDLTTIYCVASSRSPKEINNEICYFHKNTILDKATETMEQLTSFYKEFMDDSKLQKFEEDFHESIENQIDSCTKQIDFAGVRYTYKFCAIIPEYQSMSYIICEPDINIQDILYAPCLDKINSAHTVLENLLIAQINDSIYEELDHVKKTLGFYQIGLTCSYETTRLDYGCYSESLYRFIDECKRNQITKATLSFVSIGKRTLEDEFNYRFLTNSNNELARLRQIHPSVNEKEVLVAYSDKQKQFHEENKYLLSLYNHLSSTVKYPFIEIEDSRFHLPMDSLITKLHNKLHDNFRIARDKVNNDIENTIYSKKNKLWP